MLKCHGARIRCIIFRCVGVKIDSKNHHKEFEPIFICAIIIVAMHGNENMSAETNARESEY